MIAAASHGHSQSAHSNIESKPDSSSGCCFEGWQRKLGNGYLRRLLRDARDSRQERGYDGRNTEVGEGTDVSRMTTILIGREAVAVCIPGE
jgi:hypothetical protein